MELQRTSTANLLFRYGLAATWLINGLFCKVLGLVPRHERIVAAIMGDRYADVLTVAIGSAETGMAVWILTGWRYRLCAGTQIALVATMNVIEHITVPHLLLWGRTNAFFALLLIAAIYFSAFRTGKHR